MRRQSIVPLPLPALLLLGALAASAAFVRCSDGSPGSGGIAEGSGDTSGGSGDATPDAETIAPADAALDAVTDAPVEGSADAAADAEADSAPDGSGSGDTADLADTVDDVADAEVPDVPPPPCRGLRPTAYGPELTTGLTNLPVTIPRCAAGGFVAVIPAGTTWNVRFDGLPADARLYAYSPHYLSLPDGTTPAEPLAASGFVGPGGTGQIQVSPAHSGEVVVVIERDVLDQEVHATVSTLCTGGCERRATRFPIVLVHGYFGTDTYIGLLDYYHDIPDRLRNLGFDVFTPTTDAFNWSEIRAEQLSGQVDELLWNTGARKINLIGHSQGGMDIRVLISGLGYGPRVASATSIATPHHGTALAIQDIASVQDFGIDYMENTFNPAYPDAPGVQYWSWSARTCGLLEFDCQAEENGETVDALLIAFHASLNRVGDNDGFVPTTSMIWGTHLGRLSADHLDEVGQIADAETRNDPFDHRAFFVAEADRLAAAGF